MLQAFVEKSDLDTLQMHRAGDHQMFVLRQSYIATPVLQAFVKKSNLELLQVHQTTVPREQPKVAVVLQSPIGKIDSDMDHSVDLWSAI